MSVPAPAPTSVRPAAAVRDTRAAGFRAACAIVAGFALLAVADAVAIAVRVPRPQAGITLRVAHHAFDAAETLGIGALLGAVVGVFSAFVRLPVPATGLVYAVATGPLLYIGLADQLRRQATVAFEGRFESALFGVFVFATSFSVSAAHLVGAYLSRFPYIRPIPVVLAIAALGVNYWYLPDDYFGIHCTIAWITVTLAGASIAPLVERAVLAVAGSLGGRVALGALGSFALLGVVVPPPNAVRHELFRQPCAVAPWLLASTLWRMPRAATPIAPPSRWFRDRAGDPPVPPVAQRAFPPNPVVVLITIDATRAEAINDPKNDAIFPTFAEMKRRGTWFTHATSPGGQTAVSLTTTFSGRYFSELAWGWHGRGSSRFLYAADDPSPRFPGLLADAGVITSSFCSINFLAGEFGIARGFREERIIPEGRRHAVGKQVIDPLLDRLRRVSTERIFLYAHLMEPHAPYDRGRKDGTDYERYISEIALADVQVGRVERMLEQRFPGRWVLIVSADHGEAFGEHQTHEHTKTIYEELLRVPLIVRGALLAPRKVDEHVGLIDVGPTILDIFGEPTPATYGGQSLVPILTGRPAELDRPLLAEGRLRRALYTADGLKVISDERRKVVEVYDLARDPGETRNLYDVDRARSDRALAELDAFYAAHTRRAGGYRPVYKP